ncbi:MAG: NERD domain-containing protein [Candidatus Magasanikbacteria bacterium]|nr:NERD domain-containing protein [Candidatus Magasanikbacteria bacterium]
MIGPETFLIGLFGVKIVVGRLNNDYNFMAKQLDLQRQAKKFDRLEILFIFVIPFVSFFLGKFFKSFSTIYAFLIGLFLGILTFGMVWLSRWAKGRSLNFMKGWRGEQYVKKILSQLPQDYKYFKSDKLPYADFLVVGNNTIFCLEVKNINGKITYNPQTHQLLRNYSPFDKDYLKQTKRNALETSHLVREQLGIDVFVVPVLVFSGKGVSLELETSIEGVDVINSNELLRYLQAQNGYKKFYKEQQEKIYNILV